MTRKYYIIEQNISSFENTLDDVQRIHLPNSTFISRHGQMKLKHVYFVNTFNRVKHVGIAAIKRTEIKAVMWRK